MLIEARNGRLFYNFLANFVGRAVVTSVAILTAPVYTALLGLEAYGIIGLSVSINALSALFDLGLSATIMREVAKRNAGDISTKDLIATYEIIYLILGTVFLLGIVFCSGWIAHAWINTRKVSADEAGFVISLMSVSIASNFVGLCYNGALLGTGHHRSLNVVLVIATIAQYGGAILVLLFVSRTLEALFIWQGMVKIVQVLWMRVMLYRGLSHERAGLFRFHEIQDIWRFSLGMNLVSFMTLALTQTDSVVLSRLLPLSEFGKYSLAKTAAQGLSFFILPLFNSFFPKAVRQIHDHDIAGVRITYRRFSEIMAVCTLPLAATICAFPAALLRLWTGSGTVASSAGLILALLTAGTAVNGLMYAPYMVLLANAAIGYMLVQCSILTLITVPMTIILAKMYGSAGAASVWLAMNSLLMIFGQPVLHRCYLEGEPSRRWFRALLPIGSICIFLAIVIRSFVPEPQTRWGSMLLLLGVGIVIQGSALLLLSGGVKQQLWQLIGKARSGAFARREKAGG